MHITYLTDAVRNSPVLHEIMHQWGNFFLPTSDSGHWGFSSVNGQLGGFDKSTLKQVAANTWKASNSKGNGFGTNANGGNTLPYSPLELFVAGLMTEDDLKESGLLPIKVAKNPQWAGQGGQFIADGFDEYDLQQLKDMLAKQKFTAKPMRKQSRAAVIVLTSKTALSDDDVKTLNGSIENFTRAGDPDTKWSVNGFYHNFWMATKQASGGSATLSMSIVSQGAK
ncbi:hypothetical protein [Chitinivorax tropicus]|nr:hypothetical protein [Chitinivorax tropicus]